MVSTAEKRRRAIEGGARVAIHTSGLTKYYGRNRGIEDVDLDVRVGEVFGFLGPNGAGKSTTIRTLLDEIRPTSGAATILGLDTHKDVVAIRRHVGYIPGDLALYPNLTGRDTLKYFANLRGGVDWSYVDELAERLNSDLSRKVGDLSTGNRQKVGVIQAFMNRPDLLVMDEPTSGLDPLVQREFQNMVREVSAEGRTVFLSSHTLSEVQRASPTGSASSATAFSSPWSRLRTCGRRRCARWSLCSIRRQKLRYSKAFRESATSLYVTTMSRCPSTETWARC